MNRYLIIAWAVFLFSCSKDDSFSDERHVLSEMIQITSLGDTLINKLEYENGRIESWSSYLNGELTGQSFYQFNKNSYRIYNTDRGLTDSEQFASEYQFDNNRRLVKIIDHHYSYDEEQFNGDVTISNYSYQSDSITEERTSFYETEPKRTKTTKTVYKKNSNGNLKSLSIERDNSISEYYFEHTNHLNPEILLTGYELPQFSKFAIKSFEFFFNSEEQTGQLFSYELNELGLISKQIVGFDTTEYRYKTISNNR